MRARGSPVSRPTPLDQRGGGSPTSKAGTEPANTAPESPAAPTTILTNRATRLGGRAGGARIWIGRHGIVVQVLARDHGLQAEGSFPPRLAAEVIAHETRAPRRLRKLVRNI